MKLLLGQIKIIRKKDPVIFYLLIIVMFIAPIVLNFSYAVYKNYENAKLAKYLDLNYLEIGLNKSITKSQLERCLENLSDDTDNAINGIILSVDLEETVQSGFCFRNGSYERCDIWYANFTQNNFVTNYFSNEQEEKGELVALAPLSEDNLTWAEAKENQNASTKEIQGKEYQIIGYQNWSETYMVPYASLEKSTRINPESGIVFNFSGAITQTQYFDIKKQFNKELGKSVDIPELEFTNVQKNGLYDSMILVAILITLVFSCNILILFQYMWNETIKERSVYKICGIRKKQLFYIYFMPPIILLVTTFFAGLILYHVCMRQNIQKFLHHVTADMLEATYGEIFFLYFFWVVLFIILTLCKNIWIKKKTIE